MRMKFFSVMLSIMCLMVLPISTFATEVQPTAGWSYSVPEGGHWGSSSCSTSYPSIAFDIDHKNGLSTYAELQRLSGGSWVKVKAISMHGGIKYTMTTPVASSTTQYRIYIVADIEYGTAIGTVSCRGTN